MVFHCLSTLLCFFHSSLGRCLGYFHLLAIMSDVDKFKFPIWQVLYFYWAVLCKHVYKLPKISAEWLPIRAWKNCLSWLLRPLLTQLSATSLPCSLAPAILSAVLLLLGPFLMSAFACPNFGFCGNSLETLDLK